MNVLRRVESVSNSQTDYLLINRFT